MEGSEGRDRRLSLTLVLGLMWHDIESLFGLVKVRIFQDGIQHCDRRETEISNMRLED